MKIMCHGKLALRQYLSWDRDPLTMYANSLLSKFLDNEKDLPFYLVQIQEHYYLHRSKSCGEGIHSSWVSNRHTQKGKGKKKKKHHPQTCVCRAAAWRSWIMEFKCQTDVRLALFRQDIHYTVYFPASLLLQNHPIPNLRNGGSYGWLMWLGSWYCWFFQRLNF